MELGVYTFAELTPDFGVSSPAVVLAAAASRTQRVRLTSAVSVLSSDDQVRVFQDLATLDLLLRLLASERVTWSGRHRSRSKRSASTRVRSRTRCRSG